MLMQAPAALGIKVFKGNTAPCSGVYGRRDKDEHGYWQYQNELDRSKWLCYVAERRYWMLQPEKAKGTTRGAAHTVSGDHSAPWDRAARWKELDGKGGWHDAPDVVVTAYLKDCSVALYQHCVITAPSTPSLHHHRSRRKKLRPRSGR